MYLKKITIAVLIALLFSNCGTNNLTIRVTEPAPVTVPAHIKSVGIVNRTDTDQDAVLKQVEDIIKLGLFKTDSLTAMKATEGLYDGLVENGRFEKTAYLKRLLLKNDLSADFSPKLSAQSVQDICKRNKLDALFVLEYLDTDTKVSYEARTVKRKVAGVEMDVPETRATANTNIRMGWRIYDADGVTVYDQYALRKHASSHGSGVNPMKALSAVANHQKVVTTVGYQAANAYADDLLPYSHRVSRIYYVKGTDNFKIGKRLARAGKWNEAAQYWEKDVNHPKGKIAGRAHYNMAIINEINGDLEAAADWAEKSYTIYNNKKGLHYLNILRNRMARLEELRRQTEE